MMPPGTSLTAGASGAIISMMLSFGITDPPGMISSIAAGSLGACLSMILVKWLLAQYGRTMTRMAHLEDERANMIRETVTVMVRVADDMQGLLNEMRNRPCLLRDKK